MNKDFPGRKSLIFRKWDVWFRFERLQGSLSISKPVKFRLGYCHDYYDGDFYSLGFWFFVITWTNNPWFFYTRKEIQENIVYNKKRYNWA